VDAGSDRYGWRRDGGGGRRNVVWIDNDSNYFGVAGALASAGFLTLVACVLTRVFMSSHGSQDDAFKRGRSMGYDAGFLEGRRTARPVVVPMLRVVGGDQDAPVVGRGQETRGVARDQEMQVSDTGFTDVKHVDGARFTPAILPVWRTEAQDQMVRWDRVVAWVRSRRIPLLAGALSLALVGVLLAGVAVARPSVPAEALQMSPGSPFNRSVPAHGATPAPVRRPADSPAPVAVAAGASPLAPTKAGHSRVVPIVVAKGAAGLASVRISLLGAAAVPPPITELPAVTTPSAKPVVAAPVVLLTAAEQTAADAAAAAGLTASNAAAAADLTAANAAAAADLTAANAAAAAAATAKAAADAAWAVAHPQP
jgi:hypothetical protein